MLVLLKQIPSDSPQTCMHLYPHMQSGQDMNSMQALDHAQSVHFAAPHQANQAFSQAAQSGVTGQHVNPAFVLVPSPSTMPSFSGSSSAGVPHKTAMFEVQAGDHMWRIQADPSMAHGSCEMCGHGQLTNLLHMCSGQIIAVSIKRDN